MKMAHKIKNIKERMDEITVTGKNLGLTEQHANYTTFYHKLPSRETGSFVPPRVSDASRSEEKEKIISLLISPPPPSQSHLSNIDVIPIVGIGGVGKTTLAQVVYNDNRVVQHFDMRVWVWVWVCVSDEFDVKGLILKIIKEADRTEGGVDHNSSLNQLLSLLHEKLLEKRFLLVLDDVWNENPKKWDDLKNYLSGKGEESKRYGSKIIVTTRSHNVASIMGTLPQINLEPLPEEECWELFVKCVFTEEEKEANQHPGFEEIGKEIVRKCKGLPLAVVTLGCLLRSKLHDEKEWKNIRDSELWKIDSKDDGILPALRLSYNYLPSHLKQCFSYCSIFPKDHLYSNLELILFWMAHGLLQPTNEKEELEPEDLGELYLKQLVSASFFQVGLPFPQIFKTLKIEDFFNDLLSKRGASDFKIHDLIHDLAISTMQSEREVRHLSVRNNENGIHSPCPFKSDKIRTIGQWQEGGANAVKLISNKFKYLRVLILRRQQFRLLPDCFDEMKHLRFLDLSLCRNLEKLPNSICKLHLLQSLILERCLKIQELPRRMRNLISLRHLHITVQVTHLSSVGVGCFNFLQSLMIVNCINLVRLPCDICCLSSLKKLVIENCMQLASFEDEGEEGKQNKVVKDLSLQIFMISVLPKLKVLPNWLKRSSKTLQQVIIMAAGITVLPEWLPNLTTLDTLAIVTCPQLLSLPDNMNHLHSLQHLYIINCPELIAKYKQGTGPDWPKIAHVPHLKIMEIVESMNEATFFETMNVLSRWQEILENLSEKEAESLVRRLMNVIA